MGILFYLKESNPFPPITPWTETFTGTNGDAPNEMYWTKISDFPPWGLTGLNTTAVTIQDNKFNFDSNGTSGKDTFTQLNCKIRGDFDLQLDFDLTLFNLSGGTDAQYAPLVYLYDDSSNMIAWIARAKSNIQVNGYGSDGNAAAVDFYARQEQSGKLRLVRSGNNFYVYMWNNRWEYNGNTSGRYVGNKAGGDISVFVRFKNAQGNTVNANMDNFKILTGELIAP
jgi:hypothetical protein